MNRICPICFEDDGLNIRQTCGECNAHMHIDCWRSYIMHEWFDNGKWVLCPLCREGFPYPTLYQFVIKLKKIQTYINKSKTLEAQMIHFSSLCKHILTVSDKHFKLFEHHLLQTESLLYNLATHYSVKYADEAYKFVATRGKI